MSYVDWLESQKRVKALEARVAELEAKLEKLGAPVEVKRPVGRPRKA